MERISLTVQDAAAATGLSVTTIRKAIRDGALPAHQPTRVVLILPADLRAWIETAPDRGPT